MLVSELTEQQAKTALQAYRDYFNEVDKILADDKDTIAKPVRHAIGDYNYISILQKTVTILSLPSEQKPPLKP